MFLIKIKDNTKRVGFHISKILDLFNFFYLANKDLINGIEFNSRILVGNLLDVGCGNKPYKSYFEHCNSYTGLDIENEGHDHLNEDIDVYYNGEQFPFCNNSYDSVFTSQVFEHVFNPNIFLSEIYRVLKPEGHLLITVPFIWPEHEQPNDFGRYTSFGIKSMLQTSGFEIVRQNKTIQNFSIFSQLLLAYIYPFLRTNSIFFNLLIRLIIVFPINIFGLILSVILPKSDIFFLDNIFLCKKK